MGNDSIVRIRMGVEGQAQVDAAFKQAAAGLQSLKSAAVGITAAIAAVSGLSKIEDSISKVIGLGSELSHLKATLQTSIPDLLAIRKLITETGGESQNAGAMITKMQKAIAGAAFEGGAAERALSKMGLSAEELSTKGPLQQIQALGAGLNGIVNPTERAASVMAIFGKTGTEMLAIFENGEALKHLSDGAGTFGEVMERNAKALRDIDVTFSRIKSIGTKFWAGVLDQLPVQSISDTINKEMASIDVTAAGQRVGAFINVAIEQWKSGRFGDFVALSIEAGFETGIKASEEQWNKFMAAIGGTQFWKVIAQNTLILSQEFVKGLSIGFTYIKQGFDAVLIYAASGIRYGMEHLSSMLKSVFADVVNFLAVQIERVINGSAAALNKLPGVKLGTVSLGRADRGSSIIEENKSWGESWQMASEKAESTRSALAQFFDSGVAATKELFDLNHLLTGEHNAQGTAVERLNRLVNDQLDTIKQSVTASAAQVTNFAALENVMRRLRADEASSKAALMGLESHRAKIEADFTKTAAEKYPERRAALTAERTELENIIKTLRERQNSPGLDPQQREQIGQRIDSHESQLVAKNREIGALGPNPSSLVDQMSSAITQLQDRIGTLQESIARGFTDIVGTAVDSVSQSITGLIMGTETWNEALANVGRTILTSIISAIVRMFVTWIANLLILKALKAIFHTTDNTEAASSAAAWAPAAIAASIASYGAAATAGTTAAIAGIALGTAFTAALSTAGGAFMEGGYTGDMPTTSIAGVVHGREFVVPAADTARIGVANLERMLAGSEPMAPMANDKGTKVYFVNGKDEINNHARNDPDFEHIVADIFARHSYKWKG